MTMIYRIKLDRPLTLGGISNAFEGVGFRTKRLDNEVEVQPWSSTKFLFLTWSTAFLIKSVLVRPVEKGADVEVIFSRLIIFSSIAVYIGLFCSMVLSGTIRNDEVARVIPAFIIGICILYGLIFLTLTSTLKREVKKMLGATLLNPKV